jgi:Ca2+-binding RTX toxin-like protein
MLYAPRKYRLANDSIKMKLLGLLNIGVLCFTLFTATSNIILKDDNSILALTRGTSYDDLLISNMTENDNQTSQMDITETMGVNGSQRGESEFIYGDYGNDEIRGSNMSDHLSGGPGSDVIYGNDGGDFIEGGSGVDSLYGDAGDDVLSGGEGADYFDCGPGVDSIDDFDSTEGDYALGNCEVIENEGAPAQ